MEIQVAGEQELAVFGARLGALLVGDECIELVGDLGAGKTTLVKAIAAGMGVTDDVGSPSYTLSQTYETSRGTRLAHYDFYRLDEPGILAQELHDVLADKETVVAIEWADIVEGILPADHIRIQIIPTSDDGRQLLLTAHGDTDKRLLEQLQ